MYRAVGLLFVAFMLVCPGEGFAYRPFVTEDAGVAGKGVAQLEASWDYMSWRTKDRDRLFVLVPIYGITERIELSIEIPYLFYSPAEGDNENGIGDVNLVGKFQLLEEKETRPAVALKGAMKTKTGDEDRGLGSGDMDFSIVGAASKTLGDFTLHAMLGYTFVGDNDDRNIRDIYLYGVAADYALSEKVHLAAEIVGNRHPSRDVSAEMAGGLLGITYKVSEKLTFDAAVRHGFNSTVPEWSTAFGVTLTF